MLVLTRKPGEDIVMTLTEPLPAGTRIVVRHVAVHGDRARTAVTAPRSVSIHRGEVQGWVDAGDCAHRVNGDGSGLLSVAGIAPM